MDLGETIELGWDTAVGYMDLWVLVPSPDLVFIFLRMLMSLFLMVLVGSLLITLASRNLNNSQANLNNSQVNPPLGKVSPLPKLTLLLPGKESLLLRQIPPLGKELLLPRQTPLLPGKLVHLQQQLFLLEKPVLLWRLLSLLLPGKESLLPRPIPPSGHYPLILP